RWGVDLAQPCRAPDPAGSCPNCFSHDDPNDPARAPGPGPRAWWNNSSCRNPDFRLPNLGDLDHLALPQLGNRMALLERLERWRRNIDAAAHAGCFDSWEVHRQRALELLGATRPGRHNPFDLTQEPDRIRDQYGREEWGQALLVANTIR